MKSNPKNTAMYRKFIRTPKILSWFLGISLWFAILVGAMNQSWIAYISISLLGVAVCGAIADLAGEYMTRSRFHDWVKETQGLSNDEEIDEFLEDVDPEELEEMVQDNE